MHDGEGEEHGEVDESLSKSRRHSTRLYAHADGPHTIQPAAICFSYF